MLGEFIKTRHLMGEWTDGVTTVGNQEATNWGTVNFFTLEEVNSLPILKDGSLVLVTQIKLIRGTNDDPTCKEKEQFLYFVSRNFLPLSTTWLSGDALNQLDVWSKVTAQSLGSGPASCLNWPASSYSELSVDPGSRIRNGPISS